jgi:hypothetical protein
MTIFSPKTAKDDNGKAEAFYLTDAQYVGKGRARLKTSFRKDITKAGRNIAKGICTFEVEGENVPLSVVIGDSAYDAETFRTLAAAMRRVRPRTLDLQEAADAFFPEDRKTGDHPEVKHEPVLIGYEVTVKEGAERDYYNARFFAVDDSGAEIDVKTLPSA